MTKPIIRHNGIVSKITDRGAEINIAVSSACAGCHAGSSCGMADNKSRVIEVKNLTRSVNIGEQVEIEGAQSTGLKAVFFAYVLPFIFVMMTLIITITAFNVTEIRAGLFSLLILPIYYFVLYFLRSKFEKKYTFRII